MKFITVLLKLVLVQAQVGKINLPRSKIIQKIVKIMAQAVIIATYFIVIIVINSPCIIGNCYYSHIY